MSEQKPPLHGVLVADFSRVLAGPFATMTLGDLGADVIKVERPETGDDTRSWGPPWRDGESTYYQGLNRNKRSLTLDLLDESDRKLAERLALRADVLVESFRPGLMASWGLDGETLRAKHPGLITCSITAFGSDEASAELPGYDLLLQAMGGLMSITGERDGRPLKVGSAVVDLVCGLLAVVGIQAALIERAHTGKGRHVEISLLDSALTTLLNQGSAWALGETLPQRRGNRHPSIAPYETYEAADRSFALAVGNDQIFARLCNAISAPHLISDARFNTNTARISNVDSLEEELERIFKANTADHWIELLHAAKVPVGPINDVSEAFALADRLGRGIVQELKGESQLASAITIDGKRLAIDRPPPRLDEHGDELRAWLKRD
jgi:crotonobetainyl-CoA:carnitine CoA-transferase CaiB-like acyl-CoA transferase